MFGFVESIFMNVKLFFVLHILLGIYTLGFYAYGFYVLSDSVMVSRSVMDNHDWLVRILAVITFHLGYLFTYSERICLEITGGKRIAMWATAFIITIVALSYSLLNTPDEGYRVLSTISSSDAEYTAYKHNAGGKCVVTVWRRQESSFLCHRVRKILFEKEKCLQNFKLRLNSTTGLLFLDGPGNKMYGVR